MRVVQGDSDFAARLLAWFDVHGRHDLPWQQPRSAYRVWISEVMLQQTQVATVIPYFQRFMARFPDIAALAAAAQDDVLAHWSGLGYYARGRNLHAAARAIVDEHGGEFPRDYDAVRALPGIGPSTAAAICAQAFGQRHAILDGNVKRVLARHAGITGWPGQPAVARQLQAEADARLPQRRLADYSQAIMDLGAMVCSRRAHCAQCPVSTDCQALASDRVHLLPTPRPRRERPVRHGYLLLLSDAEQRYWLAPRPAPGIWGGLWSPPVVERLDDALLLRHRLAPEDAETLTEIQHDFTHFQWRLQPLRWRLRPQAMAAEGGGDWVNIPDALALGLPAPVRSLLHHLHTSNVQDRQP